MIVLDASALLAFMFRETGHEQVGMEIGDSCMSTVNMAEVIARFVRDGHDATLIEQRLLKTTIEWVPFDEADARQTAQLLPGCTHLGLSLGDRACLALAVVRGLPALTADRSWRDLDVGSEIRCIRQST